MRLVAPGRAGAEKREPKCMKGGFSGHAGQKNAVSLEALGGAEAQAEWRHPVRGQPRPQRWGRKVAQLILAAERDVGADEFGLDGVQQSSGGLERRCGRPGKEEGELSATMHVPRRVLDFLRDSVKTAPCAAEPPQARNPN